MSRLPRWRRRRAPRDAEDVSDGPPPPEGVHALLDDGSVVPCECVYVGKEDGIRRWETVTLLPFGRVRSIGIDVLPPKTSVGLGLGMNGPLRPPRWG